MSNQPLFRSRSIIPVRLADWLNWCSGNDGSQLIVLPLIQRGSVWKPAQILNLWDSLLRGMPVGSFMLNTLKADGDVRVRRPGRKESVPLEQDAYGLLDGQQRTLAMLTGWPLCNGQEPMDRRLWVDFADKPGSEHLFRLRLTSANHPFGYQRENPSTRLPITDRRKAEIAYRARFTLEVGKLADFRRSAPYHGGPSLPLDLADLVRWFNDTDSPETWQRKVTEAAATISRYTLSPGEQTAKQVDPSEIRDLAESASVQERIKALHTALSRLQDLEVPLLSIDLTAIQASVSDSDEDPALAILFKRVGTGGTPLSDADYMFSVIKHHCPQTHDLVEKLLSPEDHLKNYNIAARLSPTGLVASAVRLAAAKCLNADGRALPDQEVLDKSQFTRVLSQTVTLRGEKVVEGRTGRFLDKSLLPLLMGTGQITLDHAFHALADLLKYRGPGDVGLPPHALILLNRPLLQVLLFWIHRELERNKPLEPQRDDLIRFVLFWSVTMKKPEQAGRLAFKVINDPDNYGPGSTVLYRIYRACIGEQHEYAISLISPQNLTSVANDVVHVTSPPEPHKLLLGWHRFAEPGEESGKHKAARQLYQRWWTSGNEYKYKHSLLLWLQRDYVCTLPGSPVAGREEETPYDFDHILPSAHWAGWRGVSRDRPDSIQHYLPKNDSEAWIGNSIGNVRVWSAYDNRSDGDDSPAVKFGRGDFQVHMRNSLIQSDQWHLWQACSRDDSSSCEWNIDRSKAFQWAVEARAFSLYEKYFEDAGFGRWTDGAIAWPISPSRS